VLLALMSGQCFHCVDVDEFFGSEAVVRRAESLYGKPCPLCSRRVQRGEISVIVDKRNAKKIEDDSIGWNASGVRPRGFEGFLESELGKPSSSGIAEALRVQVSSVPLERHRHVCEIATGVLVGRVSTDFVLKGGLEAEKQGDSEREKRAYRTIMEYGHAGEDREAAGKLYLGVVKRQKNFREEAVEYFRAVTPSANGRIRAAAFFMLGRIMEDSGDVKAAESVFRECVDKGSGYGRAMAAEKLGNLLTEGSPQAARDFFNIALSCEDRELSTRVSISTALMDFKEGDVEQAVWRWEYAFANGEKELRAISAFNLGMVYSLGASSSRMRELARKYYTIALESSRPHISQMAREALDRLN